MRITFECGCTRDVDLSGNSQQRREKADYLENQKCYSCLEAAEERKFTADGWPSLTGSERQVEWASGIRRRIVKQLRDSHVFTSPFHAVARKVWPWPSPYPPSELTPNLETFAATCAEYLLTQAKTLSDAHWWIEHRDDGVGALIAMHPDHLLTIGRLQAGKITEEQAAAEKIGAEIEAEMQRDAEEEAIVRPQNAKTPLVARIDLKHKPGGAQLGNEWIAIEFPEKSEVLRAIVKGYGFRWNETAWAFTPNESLTTADCVAEIGNKLLAAGFPVRIFDPDTRAKAISGTGFARLNLRLVDQFSAKRVVLSWPRESDFYSAAKKLPGAKYDRDLHRITVPIDAFDEILDFAEMYEFRVTKGAQALLGAKQAAATASVAVQVAAKNAAKAPSSARPKLEAPAMVEVPNDLVD
jgi:hypothetical protein